MDFCEKLRGLLEKATPGHCESVLDTVLTKEGGGMGEPSQELVVGGTYIARLTIHSTLSDGDLLAYLRNHAEAILRVVQAAKEPHSTEGVKRLREAIAALDEEA